MLTYSTAKFTSSERNTFKTCENSFPARRNNGKRIPVERFLPSAAATHCRNNEIAFLSTARLSSSNSLVTHTITELIKPAHVDCTSPLPVESYALVPTSSVRTKVFDCRLDKSSLTASCLDYEKTPSGQ